MSDPGSKALLPAGLRDLLPNDAALEAAVIERLMAGLAARGFDRVKPPLVEFEDTLLNGPGAQRAHQTFRLADPLSNRMMGVRADITPQIARIAATRLAGAPRPLRLCYAGPVLRVRGSQLRSDREFGQVGAEIIGSDSVAADLEVAAAGVQELQALGIQHLSIDLNMPVFLRTLTEELGFPNDRSELLRDILDDKDEDAARPIAEPHAEIFVALMRADGPVPEALERLSAIALPPRAALVRDRLTQVAEALVGVAPPDVQITLDPVERRGFHYQTGVCFTLFARGVRGELGRGGRYDIPPLLGQASGTDDPETATGITLYSDSILRAAPQVAMPRRVFVPAEHRNATREADLRAEGWVTVGGLETTPNVEATARGQRCTHLLDGPAPRPLSGD